MPVSAQTLKLLMDAGVQGDDLVAIVESIDSDNAPKPRSGAAERQARYRAKKKGETVTDDATNNVTQSVTEASQPRARVEKTQQTIDKPNGKNKTPSVTQRQHLETVLDAERAEAVIEHRKRIRKPLTAHAAKLLAGKLGRCSDPNAAADAMVSNGWQGFEPEWLENRNSPRAPPTRQNVLEDAFAETRRDFENFDAEP